MIQSSDLRLGNVVLDADGRYNSVVEIKQYFVVLNRSKSMEERYIPLESLRPVPLTEEVLLKCGFERPGHSFNGEIFHLSEWDDFPLHWCVAMNKNGAILVEKMKYLHELQNLVYALTGKELVVNL